MTITVEAVNSALLSLKQGFQEDGADLTVLEANGDVVKIGLVVTDETCHECILPTAVLSEILEATVRGSFPEVARFEFSDPRA